MNIVLNIIFLLIGFAALIKGADFFVDGSASLARLFKVPGVIIGLTIVAMGTSAPELAVSTSAAIQGSNEIALSNVVGSNLFNLLMVLGVCALIHPLPVDRGIIKRDFPFSVVVSVFVFAAVALGLFQIADFSQFGMQTTVGVLGIPIGIVLLAVFAAYLVYLIIHT